MSNFSPTDGEEWYKHAFQKDYLKRYAHRGASEAVSFISYVHNTYNLGEASILDLCCGYGRFLKELSQHAKYSIGIDLSVDLLRSVPPDLDVSLIQGDMRILPFQNETFNFVFSLFTSFGYFSDDAENFEVWHEVLRTLKPSGIYVFDFFNASLVRVGIEAYAVQQFEDETLYITKEIDDVSNMIIKKVHSDESLSQIIIEERVKLYDSTRLIAEAKKVGFTCLGHLGGYNGEVFDENVSTRNILVLQKC